MGIYRLLLAVLVLLSHAGILFDGYNEGVVAVISFFLLSGFVMTALVSRHYASLDRIGPFLVDRAARIGPQFYLYLPLTVLILVWGKPAPQASTLVDAPGIVANALIIPLDFYMYLIPKQIYMPQTWSLGLEVLFYLAFPFILILRLRAILLVLSLVFFAVAFSGTIDSDVFGYRLLPGTLFIFLLGSYLYDARHGRAPMGLVAAWVGAVAAFFLAIARFDLPYNKEVLLGLIIGLPVVWLLRQQRAGPLDALAGNVSYGVFLNHNAAIFLAQSQGIDVSEPIWATTIVLVSIAAAWLSYHAVEAPLLRLRRSMRGPAGTVVPAGLAPLRRSPLPKERTQ